jgi:hypothetical protein
MKVETKEIRGVTVRVSQLPVLRAFELLAVVLKLSPDGDVRRAVFAIPPAEVTAKAVQFLAGASVLAGDNHIELTDKDRINGAFPDVRALVDAMIFALEVQFSSFSDAPDRPAEQRPGASVGA